MVREIFRDKEATEFIIVTIPTVCFFPFNGRKVARGCCFLCILTWRKAMQCSLILLQLLHWFCKLCDYDCACRRPKQCFVIDLQVMAVSESSRLRESLKKEGVPVKRLIVNQILPPSSSDCKFCAVKRKVIMPVSPLQYCTDFQVKWSFQGSAFRRAISPKDAAGNLTLWFVRSFGLQDQQRAMDIVRRDSNLNDLELIESPLFDVEIRGVPALIFMGNLVWKS